jgi:hypothetical protein
MPSKSVLSKRPVDLVPTVHLQSDPHLDRTVTALVREVATTETIPIATPEESVETSATLARVQHLRRFITGVYADAKRPLTQAKKTLDAQQRALLEPLKTAETSLTDALLEFESAQAPPPTPAALEPGAVPAPAVAPAAMLVTGMGPRTTYRADLTDLQALVLSIAAQIMIATSATTMTKVTRRWLSDYQPSAQATLSLVRADPVALNTLARALKEDLSLPGVQATASTILVDRG